MDINKMSQNTKLEVALEIISSKIANLSKKGTSVDSEEMKVLLHEREKMYRGDYNTIDKIIIEYGPEIKKIYEEI